MLEIGRRERKKQATALAIETAALELVRDLGLDSTTVEAISERADVTSRTFFNYYASKEDAVLGNVKTAGPIFDPSDFQSGAGSAFDRVRAAIRNSLTESGEAERTLLRREAMGRYSQLVAREHRRMTSAGEELLSLLERLLRDEDPDADPTDLHVRAVTVVHVIGAAYNIAAHLWSEDTRGQETFAEHFDAAFGLIRHVAESEARS
jgi:AcrR family transcriptional regulator